MSWKKEIILFCNPIAVIAWRSCGCYRK